MAPVEIEEQDHGPETVCYSGGPGPRYYLPTIECMCGWGSGRCQSWEEAGELFDRHLEKVMKKKG